MKSQVKDITDLATRGRSPHSPRHRLLGWSAAGVVAMAFLAMAYLAASGDPSHSSRFDARSGVRLHSKNGGGGATTALPFSAPTQSTPQEVAIAMDDMAVASMLQSLRTAAAQGQDEVASYLVGKLRAAGKPAREKVGALLRTEREPRVRACLTRVLE